MSPFEAVHSVLTLAPDGGFVLTVDKAAGPLRQSGTYTAAGGRLTLSFPSGPVVYAFSRTGDRLNLGPVGAGPGIILVSSGPAAAFAVAGFSLAAPPPPVHVGPLLTPQGQWVAQSLRKMQTIRVGMTRAQLLQVFMEEGGIYSREEQTYRYRDCPYFKVRVRYRPVGKAEGAGGYKGGSDDEITAISQPFIEGPNFD